MPAAGSLRCPRRSRGAIRDSRYRYVVVGVADPEWFIPDPALNFWSSGSNPYYLCIFGKYKKRLKLNKFNYKESTKYRYLTKFTGPKWKLKFLFICTFFFAGFGFGTIIPDPCGSGSATLFFVITLFNSYKYIRDQLLLLAVLRTYPNKFLSGSGFLIEKKFKE